MSMLLHEYGNINNLLFGEHAPQFTPAVKMVLGNALYAAAKRANLGGIPEKYSTQVPWLDTPLAAAWARKNADKIPANVRQATAWRFQDEYRAAKYSNG